MKKKLRLKIKREIRDFSEKFIKYFSNLLFSFEKVQPDIRKAMPSILSGKNVKINSFYSEDRKHVMLLFEEGSEDKFDFIITKGNIVDVLDNTGKWSKSHSAAIGFKNSSGFLQSIKITGIKPFEIIGERNEITISNLELNFPDGRNKIFSFGYILSYPVFKKISKNVNTYIQNIIFSLWDYYRINHKNLNSNRDREIYKKHINGLLKKMNNLFFCSEVEEQIIDDFITSNPIILERCLHIKPDSMLPQTTLKNWVQEYFTQDMKPDLICQNIHNDWVIVDYKRAKRITKKDKTARADIIAEVHDLKTQLRNYREYFNEEEHRKSFFKEIGQNIPSSPQAKGIIGNVPEKNRTLFLKSIEDYPNWISIITYNEIYNIFKKFSEELI